MWVWVHHMGLTIAAQLGNSPLNAVRILEETTTQESLGVGHSGDFGRSCHHIDSFLPAKASGKRATTDVVRTLQGAIRKDSPGSRYLFCLDCLHGLFSAPLAGQILSLCLPGTWAGCLGLGGVLGRSRFSKTLVTTHAGAVHQEHRRLSMMMIALSRPGVMVSSLVLRIFCRKRMDFIGRAPKRYG